MFTSSASQLSHTFQSLSKQPSSPSSSSIPSSSIHRLPRLAKISVTSKGTSVKYHRCLQAVTLIPFTIALLFIAYTFGAADTLIPAFRLNNHLNITRLTSTADNHAFNTLDPTRVRNLSAFINRFNIPWYSPNRVFLPTLKQSRVRAFYSPLRARSGDGLGHSFATMNSEVGAAIRLGITYTHRVSVYGSLTREDDLAVENFFGWGHNEISRTFIRDNFCNSNYTTGVTPCQFCNSLRRNRKMNPIRFDRIVQLPTNLTYRRPICTSFDGPDSQRMCQDPVRAFLKANNRPNTIFQMPTDMCDKSPADSHVDKLARAFFFHKYWDLHMRPKGELEKKESLQPKTPETQYILHTSRIRNPIEFPEHELIIAIHARRGDFFRVKRDMISIETFGHVVRQVMRVVHKQGGVFSRMPVAVHVYSEGRAKSGERNIGHDIAKMTKEFVDSNGQVRDVAWIDRTLRGSEKEGFINDQEEGNGNGKLFPNGLTTRLRISEDTIQSLHEMVSADVFIGSESAMGKYIVASLFRGALHIMPKRLMSFDFHCCHVAFNEFNGELIDMQNVEKFWGVFADANGASAGRAWLLKMVERGLSERNVMSRV